MNVDGELDDHRMILLRSMEDENGSRQTFEISYAAAKISDLLRDATPDEDDDDDDDDDDANEPLVIDIQRVKGPCLEKVVDFMKHHHAEKMNEIPTPLGGSSFKEVRSATQRSIAPRFVDGTWHGTRNNSVDRTKA